MLANYGYKDGSGDFFITVNTDRCVECDAHPCVEACPSGVLEIIEDDYGDDVTYDLGQYDDHDEYDDDLLRRLTYNHDGDSRLRQLRLTKETYLQRRLRQLRRLLRRLRRRPRRHSIQYDDDVATT